MLPVKLEDTPYKDLNEGTDHLKRRHSWTTSINKYCRKFLETNRTITQQESWQFWNFKQ